MKLLFKCAATFCICLTAVSQAYARVMECSYDYITHLTTFTIDERNSPTDLRVAYVHSISPSGGEETYPFKDFEASALTGNANWHHVHGKLFQGQDFPGILLVDFEGAKLIELQFLESRMANNTPMEYLHWNCRRLD